jgi:CheY-like chemotaxis protein
MRVLVVEDHAKLAMTMATGLRQAGMAVDVVFDGQDALEHSRSPPTTSWCWTGTSPARTATTSAGARGRGITEPGADADRGRRVEERVEGLGIGADDYLAKPCDFTELVARVRALGRRPGVSLPPTLGYGDLQLDPSRRSRHESRPPLVAQPRRSSPSWRSCSPRPASWCPPRSSSSASGTRQPTRSPTPSGPPSAASGAKLGDPPLIETVAKVGYRIAG